MTTDAPRFIVGDAPIRYRSVTYHSGEEFPVGHEQWLKAGRICVATAAELKKLPKPAGSPEPPPIDAESELSD